VVKNPSLACTIGRIHLDTPLLTTSGTSGSSSEIGRQKDSKDTLSSLGAFVTKGVTLEYRSGNPEPRVVETRSGIINSIGLQNSGAKSFLLNELPELVRYHVPIIVNISARDINEFGLLTEYITRFDTNNQISGLEVNVSCPNIKEGGAAFGSNPRLIKKVVETVRKNCPPRITVITKLSPNVTDITECAQAAIEGGTDAISLINTLKAMAIDIEKRQPILGNKIGGLSGPAIRPIGVYMVYECYRKIGDCRSKRIPIIGIGGISNSRDAFEYILAGATAVGIGTEWFVNKGIFRQVREGITRYLRPGETIGQAVGKANIEELKC
jgi:dihydroorotate dehydrogenase (NAD+) catalytic subunit